MNRINYIIKALLMGLIVLFAFSCSKEETGQANYTVIKNQPKDPVSIVTQYNYIPIKNNGIYNLNAYVIPESHKNEQLVYKSSNSAVASINQQGKITTFSEGMTEIKVYLKNDESVFKNILINSYNTSNINSTSKIRAIYVDKTYLTINPNTKNAYTINASIRPITSINEELIYKSTNENVVVVSNKGVISSKNEGSAVIIIYAKNNPAKYTQIAVTVSNNGAENSGSFQAPEGVTKIDLNADPFSLIAKYQVLEYKINDNSFKKAGKESNLRVNVDLSMLGENIVKILMYINLDGKEVKLIQKKNLSDYGSIPDIFKSLGAEITGDYTMTFTLDPLNYTELANQGLVEKGDNIILNIGKVENYTAAAGLGDDISFDVNTVPVEGGNGGGSSGSAGNEVKEIILDTKTYTPFEANEKFIIKAEVKPENAKDKTLTWKSSNESIAKVNSKGEVTILKNGNADITAFTKNGIKAVCKIVEVNAPVDFMLEVDKQDLILGVIDSFQINLMLYPYILDKLNIPVTYKSGNENIVTVSNTGFVEAVAEGETVIYVNIAGIERQCYVNVLPKSAGNIPVKDIILLSDNGTFELNSGSMRIEAKVEPPTAGDKRLKYTVEHTDICDVNATGLVKFKKNGETTIKVSAYNNENIYKVYKLKIQTMPTKAAFERFDMGVELGKKATIPLILEGNPSVTGVKYSSNNPTYADVESGGIVTGYNLGKATITGETENGLKSTYDIHVFTPLNKDSIETLKGTYEIVDFEQANGKLDVGTSNYGGVERMIGEMTIDIQGNKVIIKSKIQMDSSRMNNFGGVLGQGVQEARKGQFQYTEYSPAEYNKEGFGTAGKESAKVNFDNGKLRLYQEWQEMSFVTVRVNTWIEKKSDEIKDLQKERFYWTKSGIKGDKTANAVAHHSNIKPPLKEPYYSYGLVRK